LDKQVFYTFILTSNIIFFFKIFTYISYFYFYSFQKNHIKKIVKAELTNECKTVKKGDVKRAIGN
jgi:hypothetical protein